MHCPTCTISRLLSVLFALAVLLGGCRAGSPGTDQGPAEEAAATQPGWDAVGEAPVAEGAVLAQDVAADPEPFVGKEVTIAGIVAEVCQSSGCWLTLAAGPDRSPIRVDVPRDSAGVYVYTFPKDISGRTIVIAGTLQAGDEAQNEHGMTEDAHADEVEGHDEAEARALALNLAIVARGALIERIGP
jgi:hypothetical protein